MDSAAAVVVVVAFAAVQWICGVPCVSSILCFCLSLSPVWPTQAEKHLSTRTKTLFSILCCSIQQEKLNILSVNLHLRVFIEPASSFHFPLWTMKLYLSATPYRVAILIV